MDVNQFIKNFNQLCKENRVKNYTVELVPKEEIYNEMQGEYWRQTRTFKFDKALIAYHPWEINIYIALHEIAHALQPAKYRNPHNIIWRATMILLRIKYGLKIRNPKDWVKNYLMPI